MRLMQRQAVFLDRDGVLNKAIIKNNKPYPPQAITELEIPADALDALTQLKSAGFLLIVATNQPDVARGSTTIEAITAINNLLMQQLPLDEIKTCLHDDKDHCVCRKPAPGLLLDAAKQYDIELQSSVMVGDRWKDIEAGKNAGCKTIWIKSNYDEKSPFDPDYIADSLEEAAQWIIKKLK